MPSLVNEQPFSINSLIILSYKGKVDLLIPVYENKTKTLQVWLWAARICTTKSMSWSSSVTDCCSSKPQCRACLSPRPASVCALHDTKCCSNPAGRLLLSSSSPTSHFGCSTRSWHTTGWLRNCISHSMGFWHGESSPVWRCLSSSSIDSTAQLFSSKFGKILTGPKMSKLQQHQRWPSSATVHRPLLLSRRLLVLLPHHNITLIGTFPFELLSLFNI